MILCPMVLSACVLPRSASEAPRSYVLGAMEDVATMESGLSHTSRRPSLMVSVPEPAPGFESSRMMYMQTPYELHPFATSQWVESPARMLAPLIVQRLEGSGLWRAVLQVPTPVRSDYRLDISQVALTQEFFLEPSRIRLALRAQLLTMDELRVKGTRNFITVEHASSEDAYGGVLAAHEAVKQFLDELVDWLDGCLQTRPLETC